MATRGSSSARPLTDHEEIRRWAEERDGSPTCVRGTGSDADVGIIRIDFPGYSGEGSLEKISWDEWFQKFDERKLALLVQPQTVGGQRSNFNKLVSRRTAQPRSRKSSSQGRATRRARSTRASGRSSGRRVRRSSSRRSASRRRASANSPAQSRRRSRADGRRANRTSQVRGKKASSGSQRATRRKAA